MKAAFLASIIASVFLAGCGSGWGQADSKEKEAAQSLSLANQRSTALASAYEKEVESPEVKSYLQEIARASAEEAKQYNQALTAWGQQAVPAAPTPRLKKGQLEEKTALQSAIDSRLLLLSLSEKARKETDNQKFTDLITQSQQSTRRQLLALRQAMAVLYPDSRSDTTLASYPRGNKGRANQAIIRCRASHLNNDDPVLHPSAVGRSHRHQFFGNNKTNANPSLDRLETGQTSCSDKGDLSAYWVPTLLDSGNHPIPPKKLLAYYGGDGDSYDLRPFPRGLRMIAGRTGALGWQNPEIVGWACKRSEPSEVVPPNCDKETILRLRFPDCWNGRSLDSKDHYSHVAYSEAGQCPRGYPVKLVQLRTDIYYPTTSIIGPDNKPAYRLSSGPLWTAHGDFINLWKPARLRQLVDECIIDGTGCPSSR